MRRTSSAIYAIKANVKFTHPVKKWKRNKEKMLLCDMYKISAALRRPFNCLFKALSRHVSYKI